MLRYIVQSYVCDYVILDRETGDIIHMFNSRIYADTCCTAMNEDDKMKQRNVSRETLRR